MSKDSVESATKPPLTTAAPRPAQAQPTAPANRAPHAAEAARPSAQAETPAPAAKPAPTGPLPLAPPANQVLPASQPVRAPQAVRPPQVTRTTPETPAAQGAQPVQPAPLQFTPVAWAAEALRIDITAENRKRRRGFLLRMLIFVALPTLLTAAYVFLYASPRYVSEFQVTYQSYNQPSSGSPSLLATVLGVAAQGSGGSPVDMSRVLTSYFSSDAVLTKIDNELDLRGHYSNLQIDWLDRLSPNASREDFLNYFNRRVSVYAMMGGYLIVDVAAFDPKFSLAVANAMVAAADEMVENLTTRARLEEVRAAEAELKKTQDRLVKATAEGTKFPALELKFATDSYVSAKQAYDAALVDAARKQNFVETFVPPNLPQQSTSPNPWTYLPGAFLVSLALYVIGSLLIGSFRDQAGL